MPLSDIITVTITKQTAGVTRQGFGLGMVLGTHMKFASRIQWVSQATWATEMTSLGFTTSDAIYKAVQAYFSQNPAPTKVGIGLRKATEVTVNIDTVQNNTEYEIKIESATLGTFTSHKYTSDGTATQTEIADGLVTLINAGAEGTKVTASNVGDNVKIVADGADPFAVKLGAGSTLMTIGSPAGTIEDCDTALTAIKLVDDDWYGILEVARTSAQVQKIMDWAESNRKLYITASADTNIANQTKATDSTSVAYYAQSKSYVYSAVFYHTKALTEFADAAWMGTCLPYDPGSQTWCFKNLSGVTVDKLTSTQQKNIADKYANFYINIAGLNKILWGTTGYEYIDITRGIDWLTIRLQEDLFTLLANQQKVPYTDKGIASVEGAVQKRLEVGIDQKFIATIDSLTVPKAADVASADKTARLLKNVKFAATLAGAIHKVQISGTVTV